MATRKPDADSAYAAAKARTCRPNPLNRQRAKKHAEMNSATDGVINSTKISCIDSDPNSKAPGLTKRG